MKPPAVSPNLIHRAPACRLDPPDGYEFVPPPFRIVLPYCERDHHLALKVIDWCRELDGRQEREIILATDKIIPPFIDKMVKDAAGKAFTKVSVLHIPPSYAKWPGCNNHVWVSIARHVAGLSPKPWLLLETDMVPCKSGWVQALEEEYTKAQQPFMGAWVEYYDILNGGAVYPHNVEQWCPSYFNQNPVKALAFDCAIAPEMIWFMHNATHLMPHVWFDRGNGRPGGMIPRIPDWSRRMAQWVINHNGALAHRCKSGKLIDILREMRKDAPCLQ